MTTATEEAVKPTAKDFKRAAAKAKGEHSGILETSGEGNAIKSSDKTTIEGGRKSSRNITTTTRIQSSNKKTEYEVKVRVGFKFSDCGRD